MLQDARSVLREHLLSVLHGVLPAVLLEVLPQRAALRARELPHSEPGGQRLCRQVVRVR